MKTLSYVVTLNFRLNKTNSYYRRKVAYYTKRV